MNILFICNEYPPGKSGGIGSVTRTLARALVKSGQKVFVAGLYPPGYSEPDFEEDSGIKVWRRRLSVDVGIIKNNYSYLDTAILKLLSLSGAMRADVIKSFRAFNNFLITLIEKFDIDIIEWPDFNEYFHYLSADFSWPPLPVPLVIKFHGTTSYISKQLGARVNANLYQVEKSHVDRAEGFIAVSKKTANDYADLYNINNEIPTIYNAVDLHSCRYQWKGLQNTIVYAAALTEGKGIYSLLKAWPIVLQNYPQAALTIFGKGRRRRLANLLDKDVKHSVAFRGFAPHEEVYKAMSTANAAIFPSYAESFAVAPLEAMAIGCPVIYTNRASGPELVEPGINGLLVDPDDSDSMANAMLQLLKNKETCRKFSIKARQVIEQRFSIDQSAVDHINLFSQILNKHAKARDRA